MGSLASEETEKKSRVAWLCNVAWTKSHAAVAPVRPLVASWAPGALWAVGTAARALGEVWVAGAP